MTSLVPLKRVADVRFSSVDKLSVEGETPVRLCNYTDVYYNDRVGADLPFMSATASPEQIRRFELRRGDVLVTKDSETSDDIGVTAFVPHDLPGVICGYHLALIRPRPSVDGGFLRWALESDSARQQFAVAATGVTRFGLREDAVGSVTVPIPSLAAQRAIAAYLDAETARIEALVRARRRMAALVAARLDARITDVLDRANWPLVALKWRTRLTVGIVVRPSELYTDSGVPCLRGLNVRPGAVNRDALAYISEVANTANSKSILQDGDIVVVRTGNAGAAAVVPPWAVGGNCVDLLIVRRSSYLEPRFLEAILNSAVVRRQIEEGSVGALQAHFNTESLSNIRVPVPTLEEQRATMTRIDWAREEAGAMRAALQRQIDLLLERRRALIASAVAGQHQIPGVAA